MIKTVCRAIFILLKQGTFMKPFSADIKWSSTLFSQNCAQHCFKDERWLYAYQKELNFWVTYEKGSMHPADMRTTARRNFDHLHFFQPMKSQLLYFSWSVVLWLFERSECTWSKFRRTVVRSYAGASERTQMVSAYNLHYQIRFLKTYFHNK